MFLGINIPKEEYGYIYSTGKPKSQLPKGIFSDSNPNWSTPNKSYYSKDIWLEAFNKLKDKLEKGITLYYEVVGEGIQGADYTYGFTHEMFVYRITSTNVDGIVTEFTWNQVKDYCDKYEINYVTEFYQGKFNDLGEDPIETLSELYLEKSYKDCKVDEGVVVRNDTKGIGFKLKSKRFILGESNEQEEGVINIEDEN